VKPEEKKTIPVRSHKGERGNSNLTIVRVILTASGLLVGIIIVRGILTISMKGLGHELLRGHVQCVYRITILPIGGSIVTQAVLLENLHRLDTMIVEEVAKKSRDTIRPRFRRTRRSGGALVAPWSAGPGRRRTLVSVAANLAGASVLDERER
jgi:hypothetical protein